MPEINNEEKQDLFWLESSKVSVYGQLAPLLWVCGDAEHHGRNCGVAQKGMNHEGTSIIFPEHIPSKLFASTRLSFLLLPPYGSMKKLIHLGSQCPQDSAMIRKPQLWMLLYWKPSLWVTSFCGTLHSQTIAGEGDLDVGSSTYRPLTPICNPNSFGWIQANLIRQE